MIVWQCTVWEAVSCERFPEGTKICTHRFYTEHILTYQQTSLQVETIRYW